MTGGMTDNGRAKKPSPRKFAQPYMAVHHKSFSARSSEDLSARFELAYQAGHSWCEVTMFDE